MFHLAKLVDPYEQLKRSASVKNLPNQNAESLVSSARDHPAISEEPTGNNTGNIIAVVEQVTGGAGEQVGLSVEELTAAFRAKSKEATQSLKIPEATR